MLSDEEKKAIEVIKGLAVYYDDYSLLDEEEIEENEEVNNSINIVINLIEKQQKEIERLNNKFEKIYNETDNKNSQLVKALNYKLFMEDKIKAKIEELEKMNIHEFETMNVLEVLQSLLEKEQIYAYS